MTRSARSIYVFGIYLLVTGGVLIGSPNTLLALLKLPPTTEPWIHILGVPVMAMGMTYITSARAELVPFFRASVGIRVFVLVSFGVLAALRVVPPIIILFGLADAGAALWTHLALRQSNVLVGTTTEAADTR
jgi:hypothetical protein